MVKESAIHLNKMDSEDALTWAVAICDKIRNPLVEKFGWGLLGLKYVTVGICSSHLLKRWYVPEVCFPHPVFGKNKYCRAAPLPSNTGRKCHIEEIESFA